MLTLFTLIFPPFTHFLLSRFNMIVIMEIEIGNTIGTRFCFNLSKCKASLSFLKVKETFWEIHFQSQKLNEPKVNFCLSDGVARSKLVKTNLSNELFFFFWKIRFYWKYATPLLERCAFNFICLYWSLRYGDNKLYEESSPSKCGVKRKVAKAKNYIKRQFVLVVHKHEKMLKPSTIILCVGLSSYWSWENW